jgi:hypothetical protein
MGVGKRILRQCAGYNESETCGRQAAIPDRAFYLCGSQRVDLPATPR